jgi:hypothetical protein
MMRSISMLDYRYYLIEFFESACPSYEEYGGEDVYEAIDEFREDHPHAKIQNVFLNLNLKEEIYA